MHVQNKKFANFFSVSSLTGECAAQKLKTFAVLVFGHVYIIWSYHPLMYLRTYLTPLHHP